MKTTSTFIILGLLAALSGCNTTPEPTAGPASVAAAPTTRVIAPDGRNVIATSLFTATANAHATRPLVQVSTALNPADGLATDYLPQETTHTDGLVIAAKGGAGSYTIPIDTTAGDAYLFLSPQVDGAAAIEAALRDIDVLDPTGARINQRVMKGAGDNPDAHLQMSSIALAGRPVGLYTVRFRSGSPQVGVAIESRQLASTIVMKLLPSTLEHLLGNQSYVDATLLESGKPITGATVVADMIDGETGSKVSPITFTEVGNGVYRAAIHSVLTSANTTGAYLTDVRASGTSPAGVVFARQGRTGFHYGIPTARIAGLSDTRTLTDENGLTTAFEVDVNVASNSYDRLEVSGKLTVVGTDGQEHPIAIAHTGQGFDPGAHTVTLHFDAGHVRLTKAEGTFYVRDLQIYSLGTDTLFHRDIGSGNRFFANVTRTSLRPLTELTPGQQQLVTDGVFAND